MPAWVIRIDTVAGPVPFMFGALQPTYKMNTVANNWLSLSERSASDGCSPRYSALPTAVSARSHGSSSAGAGSRTDAAFAHKFQGLPTRVTSSAAFGGVRHAASSRMRND